MKFHKGIESLFPKKTRMRYLYDHVLIGGRILVNEGFSAFRTSVAHFLFYNNPSYQYKLWIKNNEPTKKELKRLREAEQNFPYQPKISIVVPVWNVEKKWLYIAIKSVIKQIYTNWELCIVDGGSTKPYIKRILTKYATKDPRIKVKFLGENKGIAENSNEALSLATGEFVGLLDHDDELAPFALYEVVKLLNENQDLDFIYSDEDKIDQKNHRKGPFFKPDWSPDLFLSQNYLCHFSIIRKKILGLVGGFHTGYDGSQDYDLFLRVTESIDESKIAHIPKILYHWRIIEGSAAGNLVAKPYAIQSAKKALEDALARRDIKAQVFDGISPSSYRISYSIEDNPRISIIIPTKDNINLLRRCVQSILEKTAYPNYEVVIVDNQSIEVETFTYYNLLEADPRITILFYNEPFNFSSINNFAVDHVESPYILFLNNDTEVINREWLSAMLEHAQRDCVGAVGAKLYYPNNTIQHAGVIIGLGGVAGHSHKYFDKDHPGYFKRLRMIQNCSAVTGACLLMRKNVFHEIGGFNKDLAIAFNDVDLCLKIRQAGYLIVYSPYAQLYHHESLSRGYEDTREKQMRFTKEKMFMIENWGNLIHKGDPYYNPNLTLEREDFSIKKC